MKLLIFGLLLSFFVNDLLAYEINLQVSFRKSRDFASLLRIVSIRESNKKTNTDFDGNKNDRFDECGLCQEVMYRINVLRHYSTKQGFLDIFLNNVCNNVPMKFGLQCSNLIKDHRDAIIQNFENGENSNVICEKIDICNVSEEEMSPIDKHRKHSHGCKKCIKKVKIYKRYINHSETPEKVQMEFNQSCSILKAAPQAGCIIFYKTKGLMAIKEILKGVHSWKICKDIGYCGCRKEELFMDIHFFTGSVSKFHGRCDHCKKMVHVLEKVIDTSKTVEFVLGKLSAVCSVFKAPVQEPCLNYFKNPTVIQFYKSILAQEKPLNICRNAGACPKKENDLRYPNMDFGGNKNDHFGECELCQEVMYRINVLRHYSTKQGSLDIFLNNVCNNVPMKFGLQCSNLIKDHRDAIIQNFENGENSNVICEKIDICNVSEEEISPIDKHRKHSFWCQKCITTVRTYKRFMNHSETPEKVQMEFNQTCAILKALPQAGCIKFYQTKGLMAIKEMLKGVKSKKICKDVGVCGHRKEELFMDIHFFTGSVSKFHGRCDDCMKMVQFLENVIDTSKTVEFVLGKLSAVCSVFNAPVQEPCLNYFKNPAVIQLYKSILAQEKPLNICQNSGACHKKENDLLLTRKNCVECKSIIFEIQNLVDFTQKPIEIMKNLNNIVGSIRSDLRIFYKGLIKGSGKRIIQAIMEHKNSETICTSVLPFCNWNEKENTKFICETVTAIAYELIGDAKTESKVRNTLNGICLQFPKFIKQDCDKFLFDDSESIIKYMIDGSQQEDICQKLDYVHTEIENEEKKPKDIIMCFLCKEVIQLLEGLINKNSTKADIEHALNQVCALLPGEFRGKCRDFVKKFSKDIVDFLLSGVLPGEICDKLSLCYEQKNKSQKLDYVNTEIENEEKKPKDIITCFICKEVMKLLAGLINKKSTKADIEHALDQVCALLPGEFRGKCRDFVATFAEQIVNFLINGVLPGEICDKLLLCSAKDLKTNYQEDFFLPKFNIL